MLNLVSPAQNNEKDNKPLVPQNEKDPQDMPLPLNPSENDTRLWFSLNDIKKGC